MWKIVCSTEEEWKALAEGFGKSKAKCERDLYRTLTVDFLPEISRMIAEREKVVKKKLTELAPRRSSRRIEHIKKQREEEERLQASEEKKRVVREAQASRERARESRLREERVLDRHMAREDRARRAKMREERAKRIAQGEDIAQIDRMSVSQSWSTNKFDERDIQSGMLKILSVLQSHPQSWPFKEPVDEMYAPSYYSIIQKPMDLSTIENKLKDHQYSGCHELETDIMLMIDNCRKYNGLESDYTKMAEAIGRAFSRAVERYFPLPTSDEDDDDDSSSIDIEGENGFLSLKQRSNNIMQYGRPRRQASMKAIEMLTQVAEDALKQSKKKRGRKDSSSDSMMSQESDSEEEECDAMCLPRKSQRRTNQSSILVSNNITECVPGEKSFGSFTNKLQANFNKIVTNDQQTDAVTLQKKADQMNRSVLVVNQMADNLPESERASLKDFAAKYQASLTAGKVVTNANSVTKSDNVTKFTEIKVSGDVMSKIIGLRVGSNSVPVKKRVAYFVDAQEAKKCRVDNLPQTITIGQLGMTQRPTVISLLKKPVTAQAVGTLGASKDTASAPLSSVAVTGNPVMVVTSPITQVNNVVTQVVRSTAPVQLTSVVRPPQQTVVSSATPIQYVTTSSIPVATNVLASPRPTIVTAPVTTPTTQIRYVASSPIPIANTVVTRSPQTVATTTASSTPIQYVTSSSIQLPSNIVPLTVRNPQPQQQLYFLRQQGGQFILEPQVVVSSAQVAPVSTQFVPKTLVALSPATLSQIQPHNGQPQY